MKKKEYYSNCLIEAIKAKIRNPKVKLMYVPMFLNDVYCPHMTWLDDEGEHDFHCKGHLSWYKLIWYKGYIRTVHRGSYKAYISRMIEYKYYKENSHGCKAV